MIVRKLLVLLFILGCAAAVFSQERQPDKGVQIISKSIPVYPPQASKHKITGRIWLSVEFLENGEIGEVKPTGEAATNRDFEKYGLIKACVTAAKSIKFTPAVKDGKAVTQTKPLYYTFMIY